MRIANVGIGKVGAAIAYTIVLQGLADELILINRRRAIADGEAADLQHACALTAHATRITAADLPDLRDADIIIVCASAPSPPNASRTGILAPNVALFQQLIPPLARANPNAILIIVTNPVDTMTWHALKLSGFPPQRVIGTGTLLDSARFRTLMSAELAIHPDDLRAYILGEHGDSQFAALSIAFAGGERIDASHAAIARFEQTVQAGHHILEQKGHTCYGVAQATCLILQSIVHDLRRTMPLSVLIDGYSGIRDVCLSLPVVVGRQGIVRQLHPVLSPSESAALHRSAEIVRATIAQAPPS